MVDIKILGQTSILLLESPCPSVRSSRFLTYLIHIIVWCVSVSNGMEVDKVTDEVVDEVANMVAGMVVDNVADEVPDEVAD